MFPSKKQNKTKNEITDETIVSQKVCCFHLFVCLFKVHEQGDMIVTQKCQTIILD